MRWSRFILIPLIAIAPLARAQRDVAVAKDSTQGVYVHDSAVAIEKFDLAGRMERLREWAKAADIYQEIATAYADRVTPSLTDKDNRIYQYGSVVAAVQERLAKWPPEGLATYKNRFEPEAAAAVKGAGDDRETLSKVLSFYFVTDAGAGAGLRLMELYLENGEFPAATWLGDRLLQYHPGLQELRPRITYLAAIAHGLSGNTDAAQDYLAAVRKNFADAVAIVRGKEVRLADSLAAELDALKPITAAGSMSDGWPIAFGNAERARVPAVSGFGGAKLYSIDLTPSSPRTGTALQARRVGDGTDAGRGKGLMTGIFPVVDRGELFFQDNARIYAVNVETGAPLPGWAQTYGDRRGQYLLAGAATTPRNHQNTMTLTDDAVLAVMGQVDLLTMQALGVAASTDARMVCLDRRSGKERWVFQPKALPNEFANLRQVAIQGSPLVLDSSVYIQARGGKGGMQFEDAYVICLDFATGKLRWASYIASAGVNAQMLDSDIGGTNQSISHLAHASGRIYAMTNLGALASIDAYGGAINWLNIYPRDQGVFPLWVRRQRTVDSSPKPWAYNPVIVSGGKVFTLPTDGSHLLIYDGATGVEISRILLSQFDNADTILGVVNDRILIASGKTVFCINWPKFDGKKDWRDNCSWYYTFRKSGPDYQEDTIAGRGFVTADALYIPTLWALMRFEAKNDFYNLTSIYPAQGKWSDDESPGNVLVTKDHVILAGPERVTVYTDLLVATKKLDAAIAAEPTDPEPRLRYAEILFVAGRTDDATKRLDEGIKLLGGGESMLPGPGRDRAFTDALAFAERLGRDIKDGRATSDETLRREAIAGLYDRAGAAATTATQHVNYLLSRAIFARATGNAAEEIRLYQDILADARYRSTPTPQGPAAVMARAGVEAVIAKVGSSIYQPYEATAATALATALATAPPNDPEKLLSLAQAYPNSTAAGRAMLAAADAYESTGRPRAAVQVLRQIYAAFRDPSDRSPERAAVIEGLVRNYVHMPHGVEVASTRLDRSLAIFGKLPLTRPLLLPDGKSVAGKTFEEAATELRKIGPPPTAPLPDLALPLPEASKTAKPPNLAFKPEAAQSAVDDVTSLVRPLADFGRNDRVVALTPAGLATFAGGSKKPLTVAPSLRQNPAGCAWVDSKLLVWTATEVSFLRQDSSVVWSFEPKSVEMIEVAQPPPTDMSATRRANGDVIVRGGVLVRPPAPVVDATPSNVESVGQVYPLADRVIVTTSMGRVFALDFGTGELLWQSRPAVGRSDRLLATDDFVATRFVDDVSVNLTVIDSTSGAFSYRKLFANDGSNNLPVNFTLTADGTLVYSLPDRLCAKDLFEPGDKLRFGDGPARADAPRWFDECRNPDHLQVSNGRIIALTDNGAFVRVFSLETGRIIHANGNTETVLQTRISNAPAGVSLRLQGSRLYVVGQRVVMPYDIDHPTAKGWSANLPMTARDTIMTPSHLVVLGTPGSGNVRRANAQLTILQMSIYSRALLPDGRESGSLVFDPRNCSINNPAGISDWQAVNGGLYYLSADKRLHFLAGAGG